LPLIALSTHHEPIGISPIDLYNDIVNTLKSPHSLNYRILMNTGVAPDVLLTDLKDQVLTIAKTDHNNTHLLDFLTIFFEEKNKEVYSNFLARIDPSNLSAPLKKHLDKAFFLSMQQRIPDTIIATQLIDLGANPCIKMNTFSLFAITALDKILSFAAPARFVYLNAILKAHHKHPLQPDVITHIYTILLKELLDPQKYSELSFNKTLSLIKLQNNYFIRYISPADKDSSFNFFLHLQKFTQAQFFLSIGAKPVNNDINPYRSSLLFASSSPEALPILNELLKNFSWSHAEITKAREIALGCKNNEAEAIFKSVQTTKDSKNSITHP
jgi:hypothetical protein